MTEALKTAVELEAAAEVRGYGDTYNLLNKAAALIRELMGERDRQSTGSDAVERVQLAEIANGTRKVCRNCGSFETMDELRKIPGVISCCPERSMHPPSICEEKLARVALGGSDG